MVDLCPGYPDPDAVRDLHRASTLCIQGDGTDDRSRRLRRRSKDAHPRHIPGRSETPFDQRFFAWLGEETQVSFLWMDRWRIYLRNQCQWVSGRSTDAESLQQ